jgi:hypothetical protein
MAITIASPTDASVIAWGSVPLRRTKLVEISIVLEETGIAVPAAAYHIELETSGGNFLGQDALDFSAGGANPITSIVLNVGSATPLANRTAKAFVAFREDLVAGPYQDAAVAVRVLNAANATLFTIGLVFQPTAATPLTHSMAFVLDRSGSMATIVTGSLTRSALLRAAAGSCVELMNDTDSLGIVTFNHDATPSVALGVLGTGAGSHRDDIMTFLATSTDLNPSGSTSIGDGLVAADTMLSAVADKNVVVLTDGIENTDVLLGDVPLGIIENTDLFAIGLGTYTGVDANLEAITAGLGNHLLITDAITGDQAFKLDKYFYQILLDIKNTAIIVDPEATLTAGVEHVLPFTITEADQGFEAVVFTASPAKIDFDLILPNGKLFDSTLADFVPGGSFTVGKRVLFFRFTRRLPAGTYKARLRMRGKYDPKLVKEALDRFSSHQFDPSLAVAAAGEAVRYSFVVSSPSDLTFDVSARPSGINVGSNFLLSATVLEGGVGVAGLTTVTVDVKLPGGSTIQVPLPEIQGGHFAAAMPTFVPGHYEMTFKAKGKTLRGTPYTREAFRTGALFAAGQQPPKGPGAADPGTKDPTGGVGTSGQPGGGGAAGGGGSPSDPFGVDDALGEIAKKFPELARVLKLCLLCCKQRHDHGHCQSRCDCDCHRR